jgi:hypothetical protein
MVRMTLAKMISAKTRVRMVKSQNVERSLQEGQEV